MFLLIIRTAAAPVARQKLPVVVNPMGLTPDFYMLLQLKETAGFLKTFKQCPGCSIKNADLSGLDLRSANLANAVLSNVSFDDADLTGANFTGATFEGSFIRTNLSNAHFEDANISQAYLQSTTITNATCNAQTKLPKNLFCKDEQLMIKSGTKSAVDFARETGECVRCDLTGAHLAGEYFRAGNFKGAIFRGADLSGCDLTSANLEDADLEGANLAGAILTNANLTFANLKGANLSNTQFDGVKLYRPVQGYWNKTLPNFEHIRTAIAFEVANLDYADFQRATIDDQSVRYVDLRTIKNGEHLDKKRLRLEDEDLCKYTSGYVKCHKNIISVEPEALVYAGEDGIVLVQQKMVPATVPIIKAGGDGKAEFAYDFEKVPFAIRYPITLPIEA